jgi:hypothetical protein
MIIPFRCLYISLTRAKFFLALHSDRWSTVITEGTCLACTLDAGMGTVNVTACMHATARLALMVAMAMQL